jgi:hypothetical protein
MIYLMRKFFYALLVMLFVAGCLGGGKPRGPSQTQSLPALQQTPHPQYQEVEVSSISGIRESNLSIFFPPNITVLFYNENVTLLPVRVIPHSLENEVPQLDPTIRVEYLSKDGYWYIEPSKNTRVIVEYSVYQFSDIELPTRIFSLYKNNWNNQNWSFKSGEIWIWEGWRQQVIDPNSPIKFRAGAFCTWDPGSQILLYSGEGQISPYVVSTLPTDLLCLHGELGRGPYFFMVDVHASPAVIDNVARDVFSAILPLIYNATSNFTEYALETRNISNKTEESELEKIRQKLYTLVDLWLEGNITKEEFDELSAIYRERLDKLRANKTK